MENDARHEDLKKKKEKFFSSDGKILSFLRKQQLSRNNFIDASDLKE